MDISAHLNDDLPEVTVKLDGDATVTFKPMSPRRFETINDRHTVNKLKGGRPVSKTNFRKVIEDVLDLTVVGWKKLESGGKAIEVTRENKIALYDMYAPFRAAFSDAIMGAMGAELEFEEAIEGN